MTAWRHLALAILAILGTAMAADDRFWELGAGYYQGIRSEDPTDEARWDWAVLSESNTGLSVEYIRDHLNRNLELNPRQQYMVELTPLNNLGIPTRARAQACMLDYRYKPGVREEILRRVRGCIARIMDNIARPENVYGFSLVEELPGHFGAPNEICRGDSTELPPLLEQYKAQIEAERGKPLVWDDETRLWVGQAFVEALTEIHRTIKEAAPDKKVVYWHHGGYCYLDERGEYLPADAPLTTSGLYPCNWSDIVKDGLVDVLMGWPEHDKRYVRTVALAERFNRPFFCQLSHNSFMRLNSWEDSVATTYRRHPLKLGYFLFCTGDCREGAWNDDKSFPADARYNVSRASIPDHVRRFGAQHDIGTPVMLAHLRPTAAAQFTLADRKPGDVFPLTVMVHNPATGQYFLDPAAAVARRVTAILDLPAGCRLDARYSFPATLELGDLDPMVYSTITWWVSVDQALPADAGVGLTLRAANRPERVCRFGATATIPRYQEQQVRRAGQSWVEHGFGGGATLGMRLEALGGSVRSPGVHDGLTGITYNGYLSPGRILEVAPDGRATLRPSPLLPPTAIGVEDPADPTGFRPFTEGYSVGGKTVMRDLGEIAKLRVTVDGKATDGANILCVLQFQTPTGLVQPAILHNRFTGEWRTVAAEVDVPEGATRLLRIYFYRNGKKGSIWYGRVAIEPADLDAAGVDVTDRVTGTPITIPGNSYRVVTYTEESLPTLEPHISVRLSPAE